MDDRFMVFLKLRGGGGSARWFACRGIFRPGEYFSIGGIFRPGEYFSIGGIF